MNKIMFVKPVPFLDVKIDEIYEVHYDYDKRPFIRLKSKLKIYLTPKRVETGYFVLLHNRGWRDK